MAHPEEFDSLLAEYGVSLEVELGIHDIGLLRSDALRAVEILRHGKLAILGGDVYLRRGDLIELVYDNWYANPKPEENRETYLQRSLDKAETFLKTFPECPDAELYFRSWLKWRLGAYATNNDSL